MKATQWMKIAALACAVGVTGTAMAHDTDRTTDTDTRAVSSYGMDAPSAGAIVTPEDKALGLGKDREQAARLSGGANEASTANDNASRDDALGVDPGPSSDHGASTNPGPSKDDESRIGPGHGEARGQTEGNSNEYGTPSRR